MSGSSSGVALRESSVVDEDPDASPVGERLNYLPGLDGIRALAVIGVVLFHAGIHWLPAGFLGVDTFFVLSGFLITTLLLREIDHSQTVRLRSFWARRARRLLPALLLVVIFCALFVWLIAEKGSYPSFQSDGFSSLFYVANWHFILQDSNYFVTTGLPSPLTHTWSLAIEEQFYLVWPILLLVLTRLHGGARALLALCGIGAVLSTLWMNVLYLHHASITRLYFGTDTHAQCLFVGAGFAAYLALRAKRRYEAGVVPTGRALRGLGGDPGWVVHSKRGKALMGAVGIAGLICGGLIWVNASYAASFLYQGGFLIMALASVAVVASVVMSQRGVVARCLSIAPLVFLGRISYGVYLWHFPLFQWLSAQRLGVGGWKLLAIRLGSTLILATLSFYLLERPIRHSLILRYWNAAFALGLGLIVAVGLMVLASHASNASAAGAPTQAPAASASASTGPPVKVLVVGDSLAQSLGDSIGYAAAYTRYNGQLLDIAVLGCGSVQTNAEVAHGIGYPTPVACAANPPAGTVTTLQSLQRQVAAFQPDVVAILFGRWEMSDGYIAGKPVNITQPAFQKAVAAGLQTTITAASASGARVVLFTAPCSSSGTAADGSPWIEDSAARLARYNAIVTHVASVNSKTTTIYNLNGLVCPNGTYHATINGQSVRRYDGIHLPTVATPFLADHIWPSLIEQGLLSRQKG